MQYCACFYSASEWWYASGICKCRLSFRILQAVRCAIAILFGVHSLFRVHFPKAVPQLCDWKGK